MKTARIIAIAISLPILGLTAAKADEPDPQVCIDRYCLYNSLDAFEAMLADLGVKEMNPFDPYPGPNEASYQRKTYEELGNLHEWIEIRNAAQIAGADFDLDYNQNAKGPARMTLTNRRHEVRRSVCRDHFAAIGSEIEAKFGALSANRRWVGLSRLLGERAFGEASEYARYRDRGEYVYSAVRQVNGTHEVAVETTYTNDNGYVACITRIDLEPSRD